MWLGSHKYNKASDKKIPSFKIISHVKAKRFSVKEIFGAKIFGQIGNNKIYKANSEV